MLDRKTWDGQFDWLWIALAAVLAGVSIGLIGPLGSYAVAPAGVRVFHGIAVSVIGAVVFWPAMRFAWRAGRRRGWSPWASGLVGGAVLSVPTWLLFRAVSPYLWLGQAPRPPAPAQDYLQTLLFLAPSVLIATYIHVLHTPLKAAAAPTTPDDLPPLLRRLPPVLGRDILALNAEDHYVRVHTAVGSTLVLSRFGDAIAGLGAIEGLRVHRSWWVARNAVRSANLQRRRLTLVLVNGVTAPVSRQAAAAVRREGWPGARPLADRSTVRSDDGQDPFT